MVAGITGASGTPPQGGPARSARRPAPVDLVVSQATRLTMLDETGWTFREARWRDDTERFLGRDVGDMEMTLSPVAQSASDAPGDVTFG